MERRETAARRARAARATHGLYRGVTRRVRVGSIELGDGGRDPARAARPERWSGQTRNWKPIGPVWLNPERPDAGRGGHGFADALTQEAGGGGPMAGPAKRAA